eukprot:TRINITY_DN2737_c0_g2_i1.p1 TRINITY_DN2737_c0_g2~~TRINITY_DN2737_c0_g2_i1.p1  ORF type:complete len:997 (-),score=158.26 TRINITY_DN2737_c0_g2_i1:79-3069(-)
MPAFALPSAFSLRFVVRNVGAVAIALMGLIPEVRIVVRSRAGVCLRGGPFINGLLVTTLLLSVSVAVVVDAAAVGQQPPTAGWDGKPGVGAMGTQCPVRLLNVEDVAPGQGTEASTFRLVQTGLDYLESLRHPLYIVPALGVYRGGKSLLLNRLSGRQSPYADGFGVGHSQETFTRGIEICAEDVLGLGTVVWMDTEGIFSAEEARTAYGPKIFSLALLFSSAVILNSVKVLNDQFFNFFIEQQQVARMLRNGLSAEGLPLDTLLPGNLSLFWVLQQPVRFDTSAAATRGSLDAFLNLPGKEVRARVKEDFNHHLNVIPVAAADVRKWGVLDQLADEELLPDYINATRRMRDDVFSALRNARPLQAANVAKQLAMYTDIVQTERFSGSHAKEAFEEAEIGNLCSAFARAAELAAGELPSLMLPAAFVTARTEVDERQASLMETFHLDAAWAERLEKCLQNRADDLSNLNGMAVLQRWQAEAGAMAEQGDCFFLGKLAALLREYMRTYGPTFTRDMQRRAVDFGSSLQRTRLVECVRLRDFLWPAVPWLAWPLCSFYLRGGAFSGIISMALHAVVLSGIYAVLQLMRQLPPYLDVDYPVLRSHPLLLEIVMRAPPMVPWGGFAQIVGVVGAARTVWKMLLRIREVGRPAGRGHETTQLLNLELKLNTLLHRSEGMFKQQLAASALDAAERFGDGNQRAARTALLRGLCLAREVPPQDTQLVAAVIGGSQLGKRARGLVERIGFSSASVARANVTRGRASARRGVNLAAARDLTELVARSDWPALLERMVELVELTNIPAETENRRHQSGIEEEKAKDREERRNWSQTGEEYSYGGVVERVGSGHGREVDVLSVSAGEREPEQVSDGEVANHLIAASSKSSTRAAGADYDRSKMHPATRAGRVGEVSMQEHEAAEASAVRRYDSERPQSCGCWAWLHVAGIVIVFARAALAAVAAMATCTADSRHRQRSAAATPFTATTVPGTVPAVAASKPRVVGPA